MKLKHCIKIEQNTSQFKMEASFPDQSFKIGLKKSCELSQEVHFDIKEHVYNVSVRWGLPSCSDILHCCGQYWHLALCKNQRIMNGKIPPKILVSMYSFLAFLEISNLITDNSGYMMFDGKVKYVDNRSGNNNNQWYCSDHTKSLHTWLLHTKSLNWAWNETYESSFLTWLDVQCHFF